MRFFYDTEFIEDGRTIDLISIGIVRNDGHEYYAIVKDDATIGRAVAHPWLRENVVPQLPITMSPSVAGAWRWDAAHPDYDRVATREAIATEVRDFLAPRPFTFEPGSACELWADYGAYDHVALAQLFGSMINLPPGIPMWTNDLRQEIARLGLVSADLPQQEAGRHSALADARHNRVIAKFLDEHAKR